jgi:glutamine amidotransferase
LVIVDPGLGNLRSVQKGFEQVGVDARVSADPDLVRGADRVVLPGVGAFGDCMETLRRTGLADAVREVVDAGRPYLGICLGLQVLLDDSEEFGRHDGLGWIPGSVVKFQASPDAKVPHMGWNRIRRPADHPVLGPEGLGEHYYFVHSYYAEPADSGAVAAWCDHGMEFAAAVTRGANVVAVQFHPEKSQADGLRLLERFSRCAP